MVAASLVDSARRDSTVVGGNLNSLRCRSNELLKIPSITIPRTAIASRPAVRETALFTPDAMPARFCETELITVAVSGATLIVIPKPTTTIGGEKIVPQLPPPPGHQKKKGKRA